MGKISAMTLASSAKATQEFEVNDSLQTKKVTGQQLKDYINKEVELSNQTVGNTQAVLLVGGTDVWVMPVNCAWRVLGSGIAQTNTGETAYFEFEVLMRNNNAGANIYLEHIQIITQYNPNSSSATTTGFNSDSGNTTALANAQTIAYADAYPDGVVDLETCLGFNISSWKLKIENSGLALVLLVTGITGKTVKYKCRAKITQLDL